MTTELPPDLPPEYHYSHGMTGVGQCDMCSDYRTLFVHSLVHTADDCEPICHSCVTRKIAWHYANIDGVTPEDDIYKRIVENVHNDWQTRSSQLQHSRAEVLEHERGCRACARFVQEPFTTTAISAHDVSVTGLVHKACSAKCDVCDNVFYLPFTHEAFSSFRSILNSVATGRNSTSRVCNLCLEADSYTQCSQCDRYEYEEHMMYYDFIGEEVCRNCQSNIETCRSCGDHIWSDSDHDCDQTYALIKSWDFRPLGGFTFHGSDENHTFMGFELEVEYEHDVSTDFSKSAHSINEALSAENRGFLKHDGSLNDGFEIVSQPHTLAEYMERFPWHAIRELRDNGFRSWDTDTCGFHVHVSRKAFGWEPRDPHVNRGKYEAHLLRFTKLIYDNSRYVTRYVAGRNSSRWASYSDKSNLLAKVKDGHQSNSRYSAVNVSNVETIEIRVFKGSLKVERLKAYLQFVHSVTEYTRDLHVSPNENNLMWRRYTGWLRKNEQAYPDLVSLLTSRTAEEQDN